MRRFRFIAAFSLPIVAFAVATSLWANNYIAAGQAVSLVLVFILAIPWIARLRISRTSPPRDR